MSFFLGWLSKKPEKVESDAMVLYINDAKGPKIERDPNLTSWQLCTRYASTFSNRNKTPDPRIMLVIENSKDKSIISKRVLSPFEKIFSEYFRNQGLKVNYKYYLVDMNDFSVVRNQYINYNQQVTFQAQKENKVEREGILQMRVTERNSSRSPTPQDKSAPQPPFEKKRFVLTQDDLIYYDRKDDSKPLVTLENVSCIPLLCVEDIYIQDIKKDKTQNNCFYINTNSEIYTIKCNSDLDWDLWIKSLIHSTNLAKESFIIKDINKKIELNQTFLFEISSKNSICDTNFVFSDRKQLDRAFMILDKYPESFFPNVQISSEFIQSLKEFTICFIEAKKLRNNGKNQQQFKEKVRQCLTLLTKNLLEELQKSGMVSSTLEEDIHANESQDETAQGEETYNNMAKIVDDVFYNLQRLSVSNNIFLEEYYSRLEDAYLDQLQSIIV